MSVSTALTLGAAPIETGAPVGGGEVTGAPPPPETLLEGLAALGLGDSVAVFLLLVGVVLCALSSIGILRMPDLYTRMQASAKAGTLGVACIILATAAHFGSLNVAVKVSMIMVFIFLTTPAAAHLIARAAYFVEVPLWKRTAFDDLHGCYSDDHRLINVPAPSTTRPIGAETDPGAAETPAGTPAETPAARATG